FNPATGVLVVNGMPGAVNDQVLLDFNGSLRVIINGTEEVINANVTAIQISTGAGNDFITVSPDVGIPTSINPGIGDDIVHAGSGATTVSSVVGDGNDLVDFSHNPLGITFVVNGGD